MAGRGGREGRVGWGEEGFSLREQPREEFGDGEWEKARLSFLKVLLMLGFMEDGLRRRKEKWKNAV